MPRAWKEGEGRGLLHTGTSGVEALVLGGLGGGRHDLCVWMSLRALFWHNKVSWIRYQQHCCLPASAKYFGVQVRSNWCVAYSILTNKISLFYYPLWKKPFYSYPNDVSLILEESLLKIINMVYKKFCNFQNGSFKSIQFKWKTPQYRILVNSPLYKQNTYCQYFTVHSNRPITQNATLEKHNNL